MTEMLDKWIGPGLRFPYLFKDNPSASVKYRKDTGCLSVDDRFVEG